MSRVLMKFVVTFFPPLLLEKEWSLFILVTTVYTYKTLSHKIKI